MRTSVKSERARHEAVLAAAPCGSVVSWDRHHRQRCACGFLDHQVPAYESRVATHYVRDGRGGWRRCTKGDGK